MRGDILEGENWKHLDSRQIWENIVTGIFLMVHGGPGHWVVEGAAHGVPGQAGAIEQQVNYR